MKKTTSKMSNKKYILLLIVAFFFFNTMGYALISSSIKWQNEKTSDAIWDVSFKNIVVADESVDAIVPATISATGSEVNYIVDLINSTDFYVFEVDVVNDGTIDAKVDSIFKASLTTEQLNFIDYNITYEDGSFVSQNDVLKAGESETVVVSVKYKNGINLADLSTDISAIDLSFSINYVQAN